MSMAEQQAKAPQDLKNVAAFLRSSKSGMKARSGVLNGQRKDYFKGTSAIKALLSPAFAKKKSVPKVTNETEATQLLHSLIPFAFFLRADRQKSNSTAKKAPKILAIMPQQAFTKEDYYVWLVEGSQMTTYIGGLLMVAVIFAGVMFPLWPMKMRLGVWYLSMGLLGLLGLFFAMAIFRLIFYIITWVVGKVVSSPAIWIFPQLFADVGFVESFIPLWEWDLPKKKGRKKKSAKGEGKTKPPKEDGQAGAPVNDTKPSLPQTLPGVGPAPPPSFASTRQAYIEEVPDED